MMMIWFLAVAPLLPLNTARSVPDLGDVIPQLLVTSSIASSLLIIAEVRRTLCFRTG
jgi:hypothetical protein